MEMKVTASQLWEIQRLILVSCYTRNSRCFLFDWPDIQKIGVIGIWYNQKLWLFTNYTVYCPSEKFKEVIVFIWTVVIDRDDDIDEGSVVLIVFLSCIQFFDRSLIITSRNNYSHIDVNNNTFFCKCYRFFLFPFLPLWIISFVGI